VVLGACLSLTVGLAPVRSESLFDYGDLMDGNIENQWFE
jgi:hypothetical protein